MHDLVQFLPGMQGWFNIQNKTIQTTNVNYHVNRLGMGSQEHLNRGRTSI